MLYPSGEGVSNPHAKCDVGRHWQLVMSTALGGRARGLGPCLKTNLFVPLYLEIKLNSHQFLQSDAVTLLKTCKWRAQTRLVSCHLGLNQQ